MGFTNSPLVSYTRLSPNKSDGRWDYDVSPAKVIDKITKITIHHMAGVMSVEQFGNLVANPAREMSANYCIGSDGRIGLFCEEKDRSWCSSSQWNDNRAITIEVSNSEVSAEWPVSGVVYRSLIKLCIDICKRNSIKKLEFTGDRNGSLTYHYMYSSTLCLPVKRTELLTPNGWKSLADIKIGDIVATAHIDDMSIKFDTVENVIPIKTQDTYELRDFEATSDHRIVYYNQYGRQYIGQFKDVYDLPWQTYFINAGHIFDTPGLYNLSLPEIEFLVAVQADGYYMKDGDCLYGVEFHLKKERKISQLLSLFDSLDYAYNICNQSDGTTKIRLYGAKYVKYCEQYLKDKVFTWDWLNMSDEQAEHFLNVILLYDGCVANQSYSSEIPQNVDVVQAIAALHGVGTKLSKEHNRLFFKKEKRSFNGKDRKRKPKQQVSCVTVRSGFILVRQHGRTTITGNCPGPWIKAHTGDICAQVNHALAPGSQPAKELYRIRKTWTDAASQIGAYSNLENAKKACKAGYSVYGSHGNVVYSVPATAHASTPTPVTSTTKPETVSKPKADIAGLQRILNIGGAGLVVDGILGPKTLAAAKKYTVENGDTGNVIKWVQQRLNQLGFNCGVADGIAGVRTMDAIYSWQRANRLNVGYFGGSDWNVLLKG